MPHSGNSLKARVDALNAKYSGQTAEQALGTLLESGELGKLALVSSFGADSAVLLHMIAQHKPDLPVLFIDTRLLFAETLAYQTELSQKLGLTNVRTILASEMALTKSDPDGKLHLRNTDACCELRKTVPLNLALDGFDAWITGRKRFQSDTRAALDMFEVDAGTDRIKVNPLALWTPQDISDYLQRHDLPRHPLVAQGYPSIGCAPCTSPVAEGEDIRAGRWRETEKTECGIHFANGRAVPRGEVA